MSAEQKETMPDYQIGFVVIGRNEGIRLRRCFESLSTFGNAKVVYVDSGSTDGSVALATSFNYMVVNLTLETPFTAARARNAGVAILTECVDFEYIQFLDGDCELTDGWIPSALDFFERRRDVAVVCGRRREKFPDHSVYCRLLDIEWDTAVGEAKSCGGDSLIRREAFEKVGGFDPAITAGEEPDLCSRIIAAGWKIWRIDEDMSLHDSDMHSFKQWWMRGVRAGYAMIQVAILKSTSGRVVYGRLIARTVFWALLVPLIVLFSVTVSWTGLALVLIYLVLIFRIQRNIRIRGRSAWLYALFVVVDNFSRLYGAARYFLQRIAGKRQSLIEYKSSAPPRNSDPFK
jgi:GT2 family glycosyltransferase